MTKRWCKFWQTSMKNNIQSLLDTIYRFFKDVQDDLEVQVIQDASVDPDVPYVHDVNVYSMFCNIFIFCINHTYSLTHTHTSILEILSHLKSQR